MTKKLFLGGVLGGLIIFIWSAVSWMLIPWHMNLFHDFNQEEVVSQSVFSNALKSGIYTLPGITKQESASEETQMKGPSAFAVIRQENTSGMGRLLINELLIQIIAALLVTAWMLQVKKINYFARVGCVTLFGLAAGVTDTLPLWNWFGFPWDYTMVNLADLVISWTLAGLVIAKVTKNNNR